MAEAVLQAIEKESSGCWREMISVSDGFVDQDVVGLVDDRGVGCRASRRFAESPWRDRGAAWIMRRG